MYRIGVLINENEVSHSSYADTCSILEKPVTLGDKKKELYKFVIYDKFNIDSLFNVDSDLFVEKLDSIFIATNATNNIEIYTALIEHKEFIEEFINSGHGLFISSQKKLSVKKGENEKSVGFLPTKYDYTLFDRPEESSAVGKISTLNSNGFILSYPNRISDELIDYHCIHNDFMPHKYRSFIIPNNSSQFTTILIDNTSAETPPQLENYPEKYRKLLLVSGNLLQRVIITSMALDWAAHDELLENILIYITEGSSPFAFALKQNEHNSIMNSYILRAKAAKLSFREYVQETTTNLINSPHSIYVFSPLYTGEEVDSFCQLASQQERRISIYHIVGDIPSASFRLYHYTTSTSIDQIKIEVANWFTRIFYPNLWGKSIWSYSYILNMMKDLQINYNYFLPHLYNELSLHFSKGEQINGSYDNVINATCKLLELLSIIFENYVGEEEIFNKFPIENLKRKVELWLNEKLFDGNFYSNFDLLYILSALYKSNYTINQNQEQQREINSKTQNIITSYRNNNYTKCSNVVLCQLLFLISELFQNRTIPENKASSLIEEILLLLRSRQNDEGEWKNLSETAEVTLNLLDITFNGSGMYEFPIIENSVMSAIEYLYRSYNFKTYCWGNDINTTAKALHAIGLYDKNKNYSANDFFNEISIQNLRLSEISNRENEVTVSQNYIEALYTQEQQIKKLKRISRKKRFYQILFLGTFTVSLSLSIMLILIFAGLSHETVIVNGESINILLVLFKEWRTEFIFGFIGIIFGALFTGIYSFVKSKTLK